MKPTYPMIEKILADQGLGVNAEELPNGNLQITMEPKGMAEYEEGKHYDIEDVLESLLANGYDMVAPEEVGALTSAPLIGFVTRDGGGDLTDVDKLWWFPQYETVDPAEELFKKGVVILTKAPMEEVKSSVKYPALAKFLKGTK